MTRTNRVTRSAILAVVTYAAIVLLFALISLYVSPLDSRQGKFRTVSTIPEHLVILAGSGVLLGLMLALVYRRLDLKLTILIPVFVILTDLDHLPSALQISQPIRPAHSIIFLLVAFLAVVVITRRLDLSFALASGFFAHMGVDTGLFPAFSPLSFDYYTTTDYRWIFLVLAVACALIAGYYSNKEHRRGASGARPKPDESGIHQTNISV